MRFLYVPNGNATVNVYYQRESDLMHLLSPKSQSGRIGTSFDVTSWKIDSITDGGKIYDLVDGTEHGKDAVMTGTYQGGGEGQPGGTNIYLYYKERAKATFTKADYTAQGYLNTQYNISGTTYLPETITETLADGSTRTWYYSGSDQLIPGKEALTGTLTGDITVVAKYYLKPTYSVTATYTTVSNGNASTQTDAAAKQTGEVGQNVPFDLNTYVVKYGFTSSNYQNDLAVNGKPASEMPVMEKFGDYAVTLSYKKSVNSGVSTTIQHEFKTFVDGVETLDTTTAPDDAVTETWGKTVDMSKFSKAGQAGYEGYTVEKYSAENGQLRAGDKGTITYVRNLVSVVFDLSGGTWNNSLNNVNYNVVKGGSLDKDGQQPIPAPTKDGFKFAGWSAQPDNAVPTGTFDQRTVFTAKWEKEIVVTITPPAGQGKNYSNIMAAAWSQQDGQDDLVWYNATANGDGTYTIRVPMCKYNVVGRYLVHVYNHGIHGQLLDGLTFQNTHVVGHTDTVASDSSTCVSAGQVKYVCRYCGASHTSSTPAKRHTVSAVVDSECRTMTVIMNAGNGHAHCNVRFAVWSSVNGQDDLTWYTAKKNSSGQWTCTVPLVNHNSTGTYFIHVYSSDSGQNRLIGNTTAQVAKLPAPDTVTAQVSDNCRTMSIRLDTARSYSGIRFAVWSSAGGQDDLVWYTAKNGGSGSWTYDVDLARHNTTGTYFIHIYSGNKLVAHTTVTVKSLPNG